MLQLKIFGHPAHAPLTHFPLALLSMATLWDIAPFFWQEEFFSTVAFWTMAAGLIFSLPAAITGLLDLITFKPDEPAMKTGITHMMLMITAVGLYAASVFLRDAAHHPTTTGLICSIAGLLVISVGGWYGGEMVYGHSEEKISS